LRAGGAKEKFDRGFSINLPAEISRLERVSAKDLVSALGEERARVARTRDEIEVRVGQARSGQELFPALILALALILAAEGLLANRFYTSAGGGIGAANGNAGVGLTRGRGRPGSPESVDVEIPRILT
jgi:hypothetical protein